MSWFNPQVYGKWQDHGGILTSAPTACSWGTSRTDIFVKGADNKTWQACREFNNSLVWVSPPFEQVPVGTVVAGRRGKISKNLVEFILLPLQLQVPEVVM